MIKKIAKCHNTKENVFITLQGFDESNKLEFNALKELIKAVAKDKKIFIDTYGLEKDAFDNVDSIISSFTDTNDSLKKNYLVNDFTMNNKIFDARYTIFYIFKKEIEWNNFLEKKNKDKVFNTGGLLARIGIGNDEEVMLTISMIYEKEVNEFLMKVKELDFKVKRGIVL